MSYAIGKDSKGNFEPFLNEKCLHVVYIQRNCLKDMHLFRPFLYNNRLLYAVDENNFNNKTLNCIIIMHYTYKPRTILG